MLKSITMSLIRSFCLLLGLFLVQGFQVSAVHAGGVTEIVVFGDSLSDTGNLFAYSQPEGIPPSPPYYHGRFSNGPLWVEWLASELGVPIPTPSLLGGTNYAWGGAETGFGLSTRGTPNIGEQIHAFLAVNTPTDNQLLVIWGGANDFNNAVTLPIPADLVDNIVSHIRAIADAAPGTALKFLVPNLPPLERTPRVLWLGQNVNSGIPLLLEMLSTAFNDHLSAALDELEGELGITILQLDIFSLAEEILMSPAAFGFANAEDTARIGDDPLGKPPDFLSPGSEVVENPDEYLFFDDVHPTRVWHEIAGNRAFEVVSERFPEPISIDIRPFSRRNIIVPWKWSVTPVAILSDGGFDAVDEVVSASLTFGLTGKEKSLAFCLSRGQDVNSDGFNDLICFFLTQKAGFQCSATEGILKGRTADGTFVKGSDSVRMMLCR
jgi:phospholipase/lecithinase/hemolysin